MTTRRLGRGADKARVGGEGTPGAVLQPGEEGLREGQWACGEPMGTLISPTSWVSSTTLKVGEGSGTPGGRVSKELLHGRPPRDPRLQQSARRDQSPASGLLGPRPVPPPGPPGRPSRFPRKSAPRHAF